MKPSCSSQGIEIGPGELLDFSDREGKGEASLRDLALRIAERSLRVEQVEKRRLPLLEAESDEPNAPLRRGQDLAVEQADLVARDLELLEAGLQLGHQLEAH